MPTASGRETAQEKRDRQHAEHWRKIDAAVAALPEGWANGEAERLLAADDALRASGADWYETATGEYPTEVQAIAVSRAMGDRGSSGITHVYDLRYGGPTVYRASVKSIMPPR